MARKFFFISAGLFLLALSFALGASTTRAQAPGLGLVAKLVGTYDYAVESYCTPSGDIFQHVSGSWRKTSNVFSGAPGGRTVVSYSCGVALASTGEVFASLSFGYGPWTSLGFPGGGPTPAQQESWGELKARYRGNSTSAPAAPTDR
jgi:hypothetical protein